MPAPPPIHTLNNIIPKVPPQKRGKEWPNIMEEPYKCTLVLCPSTFINCRFLNAFCHLHYAAYISVSFEFVECDFYYI